LGLASAPGRKGRLLESLPLCAQTLILIFQFGNALACCLEFSPQGCDFGLQGG